MANEQTPAGPLGTRVLATSLTGWSPWALLKRTLRWARLEP